MLMRSGCLYQTVHFVYFVQFAGPENWVSESQIYESETNLVRVRKVYKGSGDGRLCAGVWSDGREQENATCPSHTSAPVQYFTPPRSWEVNLSIYQSIPQVDAHKPSNTQSSTPDSTIRKGVQSEGLGHKSTTQVESKQKNKKTTKKDKAPNRKRSKWLQSLKIKLKHGVKPNTLFAVDKLQTLWNPTNFGAKLSF